MQISQKIYFNKLQAKSMKKTFFSLFRMLFCERNNFIAKVSKKNKLHKFLTQLFMAYSELIN